MESTFVINREDLNSEFIELIKKLFANSAQLQITITSSEDFGLLKKENNDEYLKRLQKAAADMEKGENIVRISEAELDEMVLSKLK